MNKKARSDLGTICDQTNMKILSLPAPFSKRVEHAGIIERQRESIPLLVESLICESYTLWCFNRVALKVHLDCSCVGS